MTPVRTGLAVIIVLLPVVGMGCGDVPPTLLGPLGAFANARVVNVHFLSDGSPAGQWIHYANLRPFDDGEVFADSSEGDQAFKAMIIESIQWRLPDVVVQDLAAEEAESDPAAIDLLFAASDIPLLAWQEAVALPAGDDEAPLTIVNVASFRYLASPDPTVEEMADLMAEVAAGEVDGITSE